MKSGREESYEKLYKKAIKTAQYAGHKDIAEDFAGWIAVKWLEGKAQHQVLSYSLIDFLRLEYGGTGRRCGVDAILRSRRLKATELSGCDELTAEENLERLHASSDNSQGLRGEFANDERYRREYRGLLPIKLDNIWQLYAVLGLCQLEIAELYGVTESRISQYLKTVKESILKFEAIKLMRERIEENRDQLEVEWITL